MSLRMCLYSYPILLLTCRYEKPRERYEIPSSFNKPYSPVGVPELPAGDDSVGVPMASQASDESHVYDNHQEESAGFSPEIHSDTASPLSEQEEAQKEDYEYKKLTQDQEMMYERIQKIRPSELLPGNEGMPDAQSGIARSLHEEVHHNEKRTKTEKKEEKKDTKKKAKNASKSKGKKNEERKGIVSDATSLNDAAGKVPIVNEIDKSNKQEKTATNAKSKSSNNFSNTKKHFGLPAKDKLKMLGKKSRITRRSTKEKTSKKKSLTPEKEKHQEAGRKNVVIVNRPPILYHPPPEIYHRPPIVLHRPPILVQRPAIVYHQPPVIVHRPAVLYKQPPLVFHQPPPVVSQPMLHSHDMFATKPTMQHVQSKVIPAGTLFGLPHASRWSPDAQTVVDTHDSPAYTGSILGSHDDDHQNGGVVLFGQAHTRGLELSDNNADAEDDDDDDTAVGEQKSGIPKAKGKQNTKGTKKASLPKLHKKTKREAPSNVPVSESKNSTGTQQSQNSTKRSETAKAEDPKQGKKGTKKDVVVNRPPIIYHPPPEIYHRPDIVIHRPPIVIHRPPIIYHQPPVIVHRPAVVYHQPPIVFHQPPPAVQQPLLYSHDTFVVHPSFVAQHLGSILRTAHHYVGPPRLLTHLGQPLFDAAHAVSDHTYPHEAHSYDLSHMGGEESDQFGDHHGIAHFGGFGGVGHYGRDAYDGQGVDGQFGHFGGLGNLAGEGSLAGEGHFGGFGHYGGEGGFGGEGHYGGESFLGTGFNRDNLAGVENEVEGNEQAAGLMTGAGAFGGQYGGAIAKRSQVEHAEKRGQTEGTVKYQDIEGATIVHHQEPIHIYQNSHNPQGYGATTHGRYETISHAGFETVGHTGYQGGHIVGASIFNHANAIPDATQVHQEIHDEHAAVYHTDEPVQIPDDAMHVEGTPTRIVQTSQQVIHQPVVYHQDSPTILHPVYDEVDAPTGHTSSEGYVPDEGSATHYIHYHPLTIHHHHIHHFHILKPDDEDTIDDKPVHIHHKQTHNHHVHHYNFITDHDPTIKRKSVIRRSAAYQGTLTIF